MKKDSEREGSGSGRRRRSPRRSGGESGKAKRNLSKFLSLILRHRPFDFKLKPDDKGFVAFDGLLQAIQRTSGWSWVKKDDVLAIVNSPEKKRFEMMGGKIRALYGHSIETKMDVPRATPPDVLYHGTTAKLASEIERRGLVPRNRQYVHLTETLEEAIEIGFRRDPKPAIVTIRSKEALAAGVEFYRGSDGAYLAARIPREFCDYDAAVSDEVIGRFQMNEFMDKALNSPSFVEQEEALENLFNLSPHDDLQKVFMDASYDENPVRRANGLIGLLPGREATVRRLLEVVESDRNLVVLRNIVLALEMLPIKERFESYNSRIMSLFRRFAVCDDEFIRHRAHEAMIRYSILPETRDITALVRRPDMKEEDLSRMVEVPDTPPPLAVERRSLPPTVEDLHEGETPEPS